MQAKTIELTDVAQLQERLRSAPSREETRIRYVKAIALMASDIHAMRSKGYSWNDIAAMLTETGLQVSPSTLRTYLARVGRETRPRQGRRREGVGATVPSTVVAPSGPSLPGPNREVPVRSERTSRPMPNPRTSNAAGAVVATSLATAPETSETLPSWSFPVRPDTPDL